MTISQQLPSNLHQAGYEWEAEEPASGTALKVTKWSDFIFATGASGETNTLAAPTGAGQRVKFFMRLDGGGDRVITVASAINQAGNTIMTFADLDDFIILESIRVNVASPPVYEWRVVANNGVDLS